MANFVNPSGKLILVVDDEPSALRAATSTLELAGFRAIVATNGATGLEAFLHVPMRSFSVNRYRYAGDGWNHNGGQDQESAI
jgi:hypothetical protein